MLIDSHAHLDDARFNDDREAEPRRDQVAQPLAFHLLDQFGLGPHEPRLLPEDIRGLADDPYRSLAWALRHAGAYEKTDLAFSEFKWADFLRTAQPACSGGSSTCSM